MKKFLTIKNNIGPGKFRLDQIIYIICILIILFFSALILFDVLKQGNTTGLNKVGELVYSKNFIKRKHLSRVAWDDLQNNSPLYLGDSIMTLENSGALIQLDEGTGITIDKSTRIELGENTIIQLVKAEDKFLIDLMNGDITVNRPSSDEYENIVIRSVEKSIIINSGEIKITNIASDKRQIDVSVFKGNVVVNTGTKNVTVNEGDEVSLIKDSDEMTVFKSKVKLIGPEFNRHFIIHSNLKEVNFKWDKTVDGGVIIFSKQKDFKKTFFSINVMSNVTSHKFPPGTYYWRLVNSQTKDILSGTGKFIILKEKPLDLVLPVEGKILPYYSSPIMINFEWQQSLLATGYRLEVAKDKSFNNIVKSVIVRDNEISLDLVEEGEYFWRIKEMMPPNISSESIKFPVSSFTVKRSGPGDSPGFIKLMPAKTMTKEQMKGKPVMYSCEKNPYIKKYRFVFSKKQDFKEIIYQAESSNNFISIDFNFPVGKYYWNVIGITNDSREITSPDAGTFAIVSKNEIRLISPEDNSYIYVNEKSDLGKVMFKWDQGLLEGNSIVKIYKDMELKSIYKKTVASSESVDIPGLRPGKYFWKVSSDDRSIDTAIESKPYAFVLHKILKAPIIISPARGKVIYIRNRKNLLLAWGKSMGANLYKIEIYKIISGKPELVFETKTGENRYNLTDIKILKPGSFYLTLQAFEILDPGKKVIRKSKISRHDFKTTLGSPLTKPKLESIEIE